MDRFVRRPYELTTSRDSTTRFATSWLLSPAVLFAWRALVSFYAFIVLFVSIGLEVTHGGRETAQRSFGYFTILGYWGLAFYYAVAAFHSADYWLHGRVRLQRWPSALRYAHSCFYSSITVFPVVVTIVFWNFLANGAFSTKFDTWTNISQHSLNTVFAFLEIALPRTAAPPWLNLAVLLLTLAAYLCLAEIVHATQGWYAYSFLNPSSISGAGVFGACLVILLGVSLIFAIVRCLIRFRLWITEDKLLMMGNLSNKSADTKSSSSEDGSISQCELVTVEALSKDSFTESQRLSYDVPKLPELSGF